LFLCAYAGAVSQTASSSDTSGQGGGTVRNARPAPASVVAGIAIFGNTVTAPEIILREIPLQTGDTAGPAEIAYCEQRIYSLGLFTRVSVMMPPLDTSVLVVTVEERWHLYPAPMLGIVDRDIRHWYYGLGVKHENFRGWNEKIFAGFVLGYEPWVSLYYSNPWIFGRSQLFLEASAGYQRLEKKSAISREQGPNFHENHYKSGLTLGKRFDPYRSVWVNGGFHYT
jgi:outer membrane protein assembly factor BamA